MPVDMPICSPRNAQPCACVCSCTTQHPCSHIGIACPHKWTQRQYFAHARASIGGTYGRQGVRTFIRGPRSRTTLDPCASVCGAITSSASACVSSAVDQGAVNMSAWKARAHCKACAYTMYTSSCSACGTAIHRRMHLEVIQSPLQSLRIHDVHRTPSIKPAG